MITNFKIFEKLYDESNTYILVDSKPLNINMLPMKILDYNGKFYRCRNLINNINYYVDKDEIIKEISYDEVEQILSTIKYNI